MSIKVQWLNRVSDIEALERPWRELERSVQHRTALASYDYLIPWYRHYTGRYGLPVVGTAWKGTNLLGVAPLVSRASTMGRISVNRVQFVNHGAEGGEFLTIDRRPEVVGAFMESLISNVPFDVVCLNNLDGNSSEFQEIVGAATRSRLALELLPTFYARVDLSGGYETYCRAKSRNFRRNLKHMRERIEAHGPVAVEGVHFDGNPDSLARALERMFQVADVSWKALASGPMGAHHRGFYGEIVERFGRKQMLDLSILTIAGKDRAYMLGVAERGMYYDVTLSFDDAVKGLSPGSFLTQEVLRLLPEAGAHTMISHGMHDYKLRWANSIVPLSRVFIFSRGLRALLARTLKFSLQPLWERLAIDKDAAATKDSTPTATRR